jgi:DNA mismatch endonuclease (patch repair protein)
MENQARRDTGVERRLRSELWRRGLRYRVHRSVVDRRRRHDIVFTPSRVAVDVRGCFWHGCPDHGTMPKANRAWWQEKLAANRARDTDTEQRMMEAGWVLIVVWEHDEVLASADRVEAEVRRRR